MGKIPNELRQAIARNIRECRMKKFPGRGGGKKCAESFGVSPQQWSPWERGMRTPDELRLQQIADFFDVTVEFLRRDNSVKTPDLDTASVPDGTPNQLQVDAPPSPPVPSCADTRCPFFRMPVPGQPGGNNLINICWLTERLFAELREFSARPRLHPGDIDIIVARIANIKNLT